MMAALGSGCAGTTAEPAPSGDRGAGDAVDDPADDPPGDLADDEENRPGAPIQPGFGAVPYPDPEWPTGDPLDHGLDPAQLDAAALVAEKLASHCLLVFRHGALVYERYFGEHGPTTPQKSWSIAKSYSATLVGIAVERGDIGSLDDSIAKYIPELSGSDKEAVTVRDVVSMTTGLKWSAFDDYVGMAALAQDHSDKALGLGVAEEPGSSWVYHNGGVQLLEPLFRGATGMTIEAYAQEHLWSKIGMQASWAHDPSGNPTAYASVMASCRDHARLGYLYLHHGRWAGAQVVPAAFVAQALTPSQPYNRAYGYLWWLNDKTPAVDAMMEPWEGRMVPFAPPDLFAARGFGNQFVDVIPSLDLMVVRFGADPMGSFDLVQLFEDQRFEKHDAILEPVLDAVLP